MHEHIDIVEQCVGQLTPFFKAVLSGDHTRAKDVYKDIVLNCVEN